MTNCLCRCMTPALKQSTRVRAWDVRYTIHMADGLIWSSPMYNGTISGSFNPAETG